MIIWYAVTTFDLHLMEILPVKNMQLDPFPVGDNPIIPYQGGIELMNPAGQRGLNRLERAIWHGYGLHGPSGSIGPWNICQPVCKLIW